MPSKCPHHAAVVTLVVWQLIAATAAVKFDPCSEITAINRVRPLLPQQQENSAYTFSKVTQRGWLLQGSPIVVGLAYWPGGLIEEWGDPTTGLNPCNQTVQANLVSTELLMWS